MPSVRGKALCGVLGCTLALAAAGADAEVGSAPDTATWVTDGPVYAIARAGDRTLIGGDFSHVGPRTGPGVQLAPLGAANAGALDPGIGAFPEVAGGRVMDVAAAPDGSWYIGGDFTSVGGVARSGLARVVSDASGTLVVDTAFAPRPDGPIHALAVGAISGKDDHVLYVGGRFNSISGDLGQRNFAALDRRTGSSVAPMAAPDNTVRSIEVLPQSPAGAPAHTLPVVFVGGEFANIGTTARSRLAAIWGVNAPAALGGGLVSDWNPGTAAGELRTLHVGPPSWSADRLGAPVYVGGDFGLDTHKFDIRPSDRNFPPSSAYSFDSTGAAIACVDAADPDCIASIRAITTSPDGGTLYVGGRFTKIHAQDGLANVAASNGVTNVFAATARTVRKWTPSPDGYVHEVTTAPNGTVYVGGDFTSVRDASAGAAFGRVSLAALSPAVSTVVNDAEVENWDPRATGGLRGPAVGSVTALATSGASVYAGGSFTAIGGSRHDNVAALDATGRPIDSWGASTDGRVNALAVGNDRVYLGGAFEHANGLERMHLAAVDAFGSGSLDDQFSPAAEPACTDPGCVRSEVFTLALRDNALYVGGAFARLAGAPLTNAGAVDASSGTPLRWTPNPDGNVHSLLATCGTVYAGGGFGRAGGADRRRLAALDPQTGEATAWDPSVESGSVVRAIARDADVVYVGGNFAKVGGAPRDDLAALDASSGQATGWNPGVPRAGEEVWAVAAPPAGDVVYAGGRFTRAGRAGRANVAAFDRGAGDATSWDPGADAPVRALAADGGLLAAGGDFRQVRSLAQQGFASFGFGTGSAEAALRCAAPSPPVQATPPADEEPAPLPPSPPVRSERVVDTSPPQLMHVRLSHRRFRTARRARASQVSTPTHVGTTFKYGLSERAVVRYTFQRKARIRCGSARWRDACESWPRGNTGIQCRSHRWQRRCYRWRRVGLMRHLSEAGKVRLPFDGNLGRRWLRAGRYRVRLRAADLAGNRSEPARRRFRVVRR